MKDYSCMEWFKTPTNDAGRTERIQLTFLKSASGIIGTFTVLAIVLSLFTNDLSNAAMVQGIFVQVGIAVMCGLVFFLAVKRLIVVSGLLLATTLMVGITAYSPAQALASASIGTAFTIPVMIAGIVVGAWAVLLYSAASIIIVLTASFMLPEGFHPDSITSVFIIAVVGGLTWFIFGSQRRLLREAHEQTESAVTAQNKIAEREQALLTANEQLQTANAQQAELLDTIRDLETPSIPLLDGVLVVPLVGHLDTARIERLNQTLLDAIHEQKAHTLILDITGIQILDTAVAQRLQQVAQAARLLGATVMLTGMRPESALTMTNLGVDLGRNGQIRTLARLQDGVSLILSSRN